MSENLKVNAKTSTLEWKRKHNKLVDGVPSLLEGKDISPKNISATGKITGDEIIENMNGYSIRKFTKENLTHDIIYAGVVKNGNKITFVLFEKVTRIGDVVNNFYDPCVIYIPKVVADKIIPTPLGILENVVSSKVVILFSTPNSAVSVNAVVTKREESEEIYGLQPFIYGLQNLVLNQEYQYRLEITFLLSENLAGE